jgi:hypothetical protein
VSTAAPTLDEELLAAVRAEVARLRAVDKFAPNRLSNRDAAARLREAITHAADGIVPAHFERLLGRSLSRTEQRAVERAAVRLEKAGRLRRLRRGYDGARTTHLQLVEEAEAPKGELNMAKAKAETAAGGTAVMEEIKRTTAARAAETDRDC